MGGEEIVVEELTVGFGAVISGLDLSSPPTDDVLAALGQLWLDRLVVVFRDQQLTPAQQVAFGRRFGELTPAHPVVPGLDGYPEILVLDAADGGRNAEWHTDVTFMEEPPRGSMIFAESMPAVGGDTMWADLRGAYDQLAPPVRALVEQLEAVHLITPLAYWGHPVDTGLRREDAAALAARARDVVPVIHPVVRVHPETGRRSLFVNPAFTSHLVGLSRIESAGLLTMLYAHMTRPEALLRHRWRTGDVVLWDNRSTMHYAVDDYGTTSRRVRRVTWRGEPAIGPLGQRSHVELDPLVAAR